MLCDVRPKPVLPFAGRYRVVDFSLSNCLHSGITDIGVLVDYQRSALAQYLLRWQLTNGAAASFRIMEPKAGSYLGTADAVYQNLEYAAARQAENVLILAGDHIYQMDYARMLAFHQQMNADVTVGVTSVPITEAHRFGTVDTTAGGQIVQFVEKTPQPTSNMASMGIYIFNRAFLARRLAEDARDPDSKHDFGYSLLPQMVKQDRAFAYQYDGYWQDIGTVDAYYQASMELTRHNPTLDVNGARPVLSQSHNAPPPRILHQARIINSVISPGCVIKGRVENSVLSPGVIVEEQAVVRNSVVMENTSIGFHSIVDNSVLDEALNIGGFCYVGFGGSTGGRPEITVVGKGAVIPPHTAIGRNCKIHPRARPADFSASVVPYGTTVAQSAILDESTLDSRGETRWVRESI